MIGTGNACAWPGVAAPDWLRAAGLALLRTAFLFALAAFGALGESWRIGVDEAHPTELVPSGAGSTRRAGVRRVTDPATPLIAASRADTGSRG